MSPDKKSTDSLKTERDRFVAFAFASAHVLIELDEQYNIVFVDGSTTGMFGLAPDKLAGKPFMELITLDDREGTYTLLRSANPGQRISPITVEIHSRNKNEQSCVLAGYRLPYIQNHYFLTLTPVFPDFYPEDVPLRDHESGLLKTGSFAETAGEKIAEARKKGQPVKITLINFPELEAFLNELPPDQMQELLGQISQIMRARSVDGDTAGRIDQHSYSILHEAATKADSIIEEITRTAAAMHPQGRKLEVTSVSLDADPGTLNEQDSMRAVAYVMSQFTKKGVDGFDIGTLQTGYQAMVKDTVNRIAEFKKTINNKDFNIAMQPIVDLKSGRIHHYEALTRLKSEAFDNPFQFITFGEDVGIINEFDLAMIQQVITFMELAALEGKRPVVAVNLSGKSLCSGLFKDTLREIMKQNANFTKQIIFEITESAKIDNLDEANRFVQELRKMGSLCCLDDFGVGESSFDYLRRLQVDFVKIDGSYVKETMTSPRGKDLLKAMVAMCQKLDIITIGEMIEDEKTAGLLWDCGVKFGQGYFFGKPDTDLEKVMESGSQTPYYKGVMKAKRIPRSHTSWGRPAPRP